VSECKNNVANLIGSKTSGGFVLGTSVTPLSRLGKKTQQIYNMFLLLFYLTIISLFPLKRKRSFRAHVAFKTKY
jgi:hypothetical protein